MMFGALLVLAPILCAELKTSWTGVTRLLQGPMLGAVTDSDVRIWVRLSAPGSVAVEYALESQPTETKRSEPVATRKENDYIAVIRIEGLAPGARYRYRVLVDDAPDPNIGRQGFFGLTTAPAQPARFKVVFGSCARVERYPRQPIWDAMLDEDPQLMLWLGDAIYADTLDPEIIAESYQRQRNVPEMQDFIRRVPQLAIWDDHDYGLNDSGRDNPIKEDALRIFRRYWANPAYGLVDAPGVFFRFDYGGVDFFMLDNRYHRDSPAAPDNPGKTALGLRQKEWLMQQLRDSRAAFKIIASGQTWSDEKGAGNESWAAFTHERAELIRFIRDHNIEGVVFLSGDNHVGELNCLPADTADGYDLFEVSSSPLAQEPSVSWLNYRAIPRIRQIYFGGSNFGQLSFDLTLPDPILRITLHDERGYSVWMPLELRASQLKRGVSIWRDKMDGPSRLRYERHENGGPYYDAPTH